MSDTELMAKSEPVRRLEIFTGSGRRRSWSAEQKAESVCAVRRLAGGLWRRCCRRRLLWRERGVRLRTETSLQNASVRPSCARSGVGRPWQHVLSSSAQP
jgi:hypothetical protein